MSAIKRYAPEFGPGFSTLAPGSPQSSLGTGPSYFTAVPLTAAQLIAMFAAPVSVLAAPGAGKAIVLIAAYLSITRTATAFTGGGPVNLQYHTTTTSVPHGGTIPAAIVTGGAGSVVHQLGPNNGANGLVIPVNEGLDITNITGAFAAGTGTAKLFLYYRVISA